MRDEPVIRIQGLQHFFGEGSARAQVLHDIALEVAGGEIVIIGGPSGSGKTTLLTLIGTLRTVQQGSLRVLGRELYGASREAMIATRRELGFIFQAHNLFESLTASQNVRMGLELHGVAQSAAQTRIENLLTRLGLEHRLHHKPEKLSGGQKQRVAIARGLVHHPKIVLADEPTAALDEQSGREVVTIFQELSRREGTTILIVTHDNRILDVADRIVTVRSGRIESNVLVRESQRICEFLRGCPIFAQLTPRTLIETADQMKAESYPAEALIIRQGDPGDKFYLLADGQVDVVVDGRRQGVVATLAPGDYFGEAALLTGAPRNASIIAREPVEVYSLSKENFQKVLDASASFAEELRRALFERR